MGNPTIDTLMIAVLCALAGVVSAIVWVVYDPGTGRCEGCRRYRSLARCPHCSKKICYHCWNTEEHEGSDG